MNIEYEATFVNIDKENIRGKLRDAGGKMLRPEFLQKRVVFHLPTGHEMVGGWLRVRDEGEKITLSLKIVDGDRIENQKEINLTVDNFHQARNLLIAIGCVEKAYQENRRELWILNDVEVTIDEWPFLEPFMEIEGATEQAVMTVAEKLGFKWWQAKFCAVGTLYAGKYNITEDRINNQTPKLTFEMSNPFI